MSLTLVIGGRGYIGSRLAQYLGADVIDADWFSSRRPESIDYRNALYRLRAYSSVILLAGHSSIQLCNADPRGAWHNNVTRFTDLCHAMLPGQKLIFASSAAVDGTGMYGLTKQTIELFAAARDVEFYALRFGTVAGWSPNLRTDLVVNAMVTRALNDGHVVVSNRDAIRPILGILDLCRAVETIITDSDDRRGVYELASFSTSMGSIADAITTRLKVPARAFDDGGTRTFWADPSPFRHAFNFQFRETLDSIVDDLLDHQPLIGSARNKLPPCHLLHS